MIAEFTAENKTAILILGSIVLIAMLLLIAWMDDDSYLR